MRIVMVGPFGFHPNKTMRSRAMGFARELVKAGHPVKMIMPPWQTPEEAGQQWVEDGVEIEMVQLSGGIIPIVGRMVRLTRNYSPDVIIGFKPKAYSGLVMWLLWQTRWGGRTPALVTDTDDWEGWGGWNDIADYSIVQKYFFAWQERWGMTHCDLLTFASHELGNRAEKIGMPPSKRLYLPNGSGINNEPIDVERIETKRQVLGLGDRPTLLLYSRLFEFDTGRLVAILQKVHAQIPDVAILTVGAGLFAKQAAGLHARLDEVGLLEQIVDTGWLDEVNLPETLSTADVGLYLMDDTLLNRTKCPVKLADMISVGIPVVAEAVGEVTAYIADGENGRLCPTGDIDGVANCVIELLQNRPLARQMGALGRKRYAMQFQWNATTDSLVQKLKTLI